MTDTEAAPNKKGFNRKRIFFSALISTIILLCTLFSIICSAVYQYLTENDTALVSLRSNSTVVLFDQEPSKTLQSLTVTEDTNHPGDFDHEIIVYQVDLSCGDIEVQEETYQQTGTDFSLINGTTSYALAGSSMTYNICGSTNSSYQSERLELVLLYGLEALQAPSTDYDKFYYFSYGTDGNWTCKEVTYNIENKGYYTPVFLTAPQEATFTYSMTYRQRFLNEPLPLSLSDYILSNDKDRLALNGLSVGQHCFIATILENPTGTSPHVHVHLSYEYNQHYIAYILFGADASLHLLVFILCILFCVFCW